MAYGGSLVIINHTGGDYTIPLSFIKADSYKVSKKIQDLDSYRDANGLLHRNALGHVVYKVEFECVPMLTSVEIDAVLANIRNRYTISAERKLNMSLYVPELNEYVQQDAYMPDPDFQVYLADSQKIQYDAVRFAFIGY